MSIAVESVTRSVKSTAGFTVPELQRQNRIYAPKIPFVSVVPDGLCSEKMILIKGLVRGKQNGFEVNLCCGLQVDGLHRDDIALHLNPRFCSDCKIVINSLMDDMWGAEQRHKNPLRKGQPFAILITILSHAFMITINHELFIEYPHRISPDRIRTIQIKGAVLVDAVEYISNANAQFIHANEDDAEQQKNDAEQAVRYVQPLPYTVPIKYAPEYPKISFTVSFLNNAHRVHIDLMADDDIAFHNDIRFDENAVVRNTRRGGKWENEERALTKFPFMAGCTYEFEIYCDVCRFVVRIGGCHAYNYAHRMSPTLIDRLSIDGTGRLLKLRI